MRDVKEEIQRSWRDGKTNSFRLLCQEHLHILETASPHQPDEEDHDHGCYQHMLYSEGTNIASE